MGIFDSTVSIPVLWMILNLTARKDDIKPADGIGCAKDKDGKDVSPPEVQVCGTLEMLFDAVIPLGGHLLQAFIKS